MDTAPLTSLRSVAGVDIQTLLDHQPRPSELLGFDPEYIDLPDYIIRCTHRIWEQRNLGLIRTHYSEDCLIKTITGEVSGIEAVINNTLATLAAFPDRTLYGEDVIWSGDNAKGFFSSHRILSHMTNRGTSEFGAPTGRTAVIRTIADCEVQENKIGREWLVRDNLALVWQLGLNPHTVASAQAVRDPAAGTRWNDEIAQLLQGSVEHASTRDKTSDLMCQALDRIWNGRMLGEAAKLYAPHATVHSSSGRELHGHHAVIGNIISQLAVMPDARLFLDQFTEMPSAHEGASIAIRWRLAGTHTYAGLYGPPSGKRLLLLGVSHFRIHNGQIQEEWTVFDELGVLRQIYAQDATAA